MAIFVHMPEFVFCLSEFALHLMFWYFEFIFFGLSGLTFCQKNRDKLVKPLRAISF